MGIFEQPMKINFFSNLLNRWRWKVRGERLKTEEIGIMEYWKNGILEKDVTSYGLRVTLSNSREEHNAERIALNYLLA